MSLTFQKYKNSYLGDFKKQKDVSKRNLMVLLVILYLIFVLFVLFYDAKPPLIRYTIILFIVFYFMMLPSLLLKYYWHIKPLFQDLLTYYTWMGLNELKTFIDSGRRKNYLKRSKYFFKQIDLTFRNNFLIKYFKSEEIRNHSISDYVFVVNKYILPKIKTEISQSDYLEIDKITKATISKLNDEDFNGLISFLKNYIKICKTKRNKFQKFSDKIMNTPRYMLFCKLLFIVVISLAIIGIVILLGYGLIEIGIVFTIIPGIYALYKLIDAGFEKLISKN